MLQKATIFFKKIDWILFLLVILLIAIGLVTQYSLVLNSELSDFSQLYKQLAALVIGLALFFLLSYFDFRWFRNYANILYFVSVALLLGILFFGQNFRGTQGWFSFGPVSFQPVEIVKFFLIVFLAKFFSDCLKKTNSINFTNIIFSVLFVAILFILVILQPDLGSALILFGIWFLMFLVVAKKRLHVAVIILSAAVMSVFAWLFFLKDDQQDRILSFINPGRDPLGIGYQVSQSIIAIGSGRFFGRGLGLGPQSQLRFLPDASTDFIFSVIAEEFGFLGACLVLVLFALLLWRIMSYVKIVYSDFSLLLIIGFLSLIFLQVFVNIGMNIGLLPVTGIPLPLVSYGNSSLIAFFVILGVLESIKVHRVKNRPTA